MATGGPSPSLSSTAAPAVAAHPTRRIGIETRSIDYVPLAERHGKVWHLWPVWFAGDAHLATIAIGVLGITLGTNLLWTAIAIVLGGAFGTFFMAFHSTQGPQLGLPQMIQSRPQFGYLGALLVWVVALVTYVGYNAFNQILAGETAHQLMNVPTRPAYIVFTIIAVALAIIGYDWIHKAQRVLSFMLIAALVVFSVGVFFVADLPAGQLSLSGFKATPFLTQFAVAAAYQLSWAIYVSDYSRYLPRKVGVRASFWWTYLGAFIGGAWMMLVGAVAATMAGGVSGESAVVDSVRHAGDAIFPGFGVVLLLVALAGLMTITGLNFYGASLTLLSVADSVKPMRPTVSKRIATLVLAAIVATSIAWTASSDFLAQFGGFLAILLYLFTPWTAINLVDFYWVRHTHYSIREIFNPRGMYGRWSWRGLLAYAVGFVAMIPFFSTTLYTGPIAAALGGADIAMFVGLPVSAIAYLLACRGLDVAAERRRIAEADRGLDDEVAAPTAG